MSQHFSCSDLCFPLTIAEVEYSLKNASNPETLLFVCLDLATVSICLKKSLNYIEIKDLIAIDEFNAFSVNEILKAWRSDILNDDGDILNTDYRFIFNYHIAHVMRGFKLANLISIGILNNVHYEKLNFYSRTWPIAYSRSNIAVLIRELTRISLEAKRVTFNRRVSLALKNAIWKTLRSMAKGAVLIEFFVYSLRKVRKDVRTIFNQSTKKRILFFSGGRDLRFHSVLSYYLDSYSLIALRGKSKWNDRVLPKNRFSALVEVYPLLFEGYLRNRRSVSYAFKYDDFVSLLMSMNSEYSGVLGDYVSLLGNYVGFKIEREIMMIKSYCGIIDSINPDIVFSTSLPLPLISAKLCKRLTISEFEGPGIEMNPMAPYIGDYVSSPGPLSSRQLFEYFGGEGQDLPVGAYYY